MELHAQIGSSVLPGDVVGELPDESELSLRLGAGLSQKKVRNKKTTKKKRKKTADRSPLEIYFGHARWSGERKGE
jgi:hypothetical protein